MSKLTDQHYLQTDQYRDASKLNARVDLHRRFSTNSYGWFNWIFDILLTLPTQADVLELGCGPGVMWRACADKIPVDWTITLTDLSDGMLDAAWRNLVVTGRAFKFQQMDAQSISYPDESFDIVIANHMLYHVPNRPKAIAEIRRVLKLGGSLIATTVGDRHMEDLNVWLRRALGKADFVLFPLPFTLESGLAQLRPPFERVEMRRYEDNLRITEVEPLMAYVRSSIRCRGLSEAALAAVRHEFESELESKGVLYIGKDSGLFEAVK